MTKTKSMIYCGLFTALIAAGAFIKIPVPVVPFTLQYLFTMLAGLFLGSRKGMISVVAYMLLGWRDFRSFRKAVESGIFSSQASVIL